MKLNRFFLALSLMFFLSAFSHAQGDINVIRWDSFVELLEKGDVADIEGDIAQSKIILLDFWASWCGPCRQSFPWMNEMKAKYSEQGLYIIAVNLDANRVDAEAFLNQVRADFPIVYDQDGETAEMLEVEAMPMSYLIHPKGEVLHLMAGFNTSKKAQHEQLIRQHLKLP